MDLNPDNKYARIQYITLLLNQRKFDEALGESSLLTETDSSAVALHLQAQSFEGVDDILAATIFWLLPKQQDCTSKEHFIIML